MDLYDENIARLIRHSLTGELSEQEWGELEAWLHDSEEHRVLFEKIKKEIRISSESSLTSPSRVVIVSPALAFLMLIDASLTYLKSKACIGLPYSSIT